MQLIGATDVRVTIKMLTSVVASLSLSVQQAVPPPVWNDSFYVGQQSALAQNQGGYKIDNGLCCDFTTGGSCKVEIQSMGSDVREQTSKQRIRSDSARGSIVSWYDTVKKQMAVVPGAEVNSTHKWACVQYCPTTAGFVGTLDIGGGNKKAKITDMGQATITQPVAIGNVTKTTEHYHYVDRLIVIPMSVTDFYVDESTNPPSPFAEHELLEPFGKPFGYVKSFFIGYQPIDNTDQFDIDLNPKVCVMSKKCNSQSEEEAAMPHIGFSERLLLGRTMYDAVAEAAATLERSGVTAEAAKPKTPPPNVTFTGDFISSESAISLIDQGGRHGLGKSAADLCCTEDEPGCQVQLSQSKGTRYYDYTHQRTRFEEGYSGNVFIDDYSVHKSYSVDTSSGTETCKEYCPIDPSDTMRPFSPFSDFDAVEDLGKATVEGRAAEHYQWAEKVARVITMSVTDLYVDISDKTHGVPLFMSEDLEPLGRHLGRNNRTWTNFTYTAVPATKFAVQGVDSCPQSNNCRSQEAVAHSLRSRNYHTLLHALKAPEPEHPILGGFRPMMA